ncbi:MAG TPA: hypothetical protein VH592_10540 [Gemmataceae bacterium]|jgi:hypothetical protein
MSKDNLTNSTDDLSAESLSELMYRQVATDDAFDSIEGASRATATMFIVYPFDGPPLLVTVAPVKE